ncbi:kelch-like protein 24 isoform X2 [Diadema antillarum]
MSDSDDSPYFDDYDYEYNYNDYDDDYYRYSDGDNYSFSVGWAHETGRKADDDFHVRQKQREEVQAARKYLQEGTRKENPGGDTAFRALYDQEQYSDLILSVGNRTFFAHRLVLCAWSDVFKTMLSDPTWQPNNKLCDERSDNASGQVIRQELVEEDPDALVFEDFLKFLYTAAVALTTENVLSLIRLADKYMIPELHGLCNEFIDNSDVVMMLSLLPTAQEFNMPDIVKLCHQSFLTNFNLLSGQQLLDIDAATMLVILDSGLDLVVESEYALFEKIEPWLTQCEDDDIFVEIIKCIRFPFMNALQLKKVTVTAIFSRATEKLQDLPLKVWQIQTLFREGSHGELPDEFSGPRLYLRPPNRYDSEDQIGGSLMTNDRNFNVTVGSQKFLRVSPCITKVLGEKQIFEQGKDIEMGVLVTKDPVSEDQIEIKLSSKLPSATQKYHTAIVISQRKQTPRYFKNSDFATLQDTESSRKIGSVGRRRGFHTISTETRPTILNCKAKLTQPVEQGKELQICVALIIEMQEDHEEADSKTLTTENSEMSPQERLLFRYRDYILTQHLLRLQMFDF